MYVNKQQTGKTNTTPLVEKATPTCYKIPRSASGDYHPFHVTTVMRKNVNICHEEDEFRREIAPATPGQLAVYACQVYLIQATKLGHHTFFMMPNRVVCQEALKGFELLGATEHKQILAKVLSMFPNSKMAKDPERRDRQLCRLDESVLNELEDRLRELEDEFYSLVRGYILKHPDEFFVDA